MIINRNIPIGKITEEHNTIVAFKIYNTLENKTKMLSREKVKEMLLRGEKIKGMDFYRNANTGKWQLKRYMDFIWTNIAEMDGKGEPEDGVHRKIFVGFFGYKENRSFLVVNDAGKVDVLTSDEVRNIFKAGDTIIGLIVSKDGRIIPRYKDEYYDEDLEAKGFVKQEDFSWKKAN